LPPGGYDPHAEGRQEAAMSTFPAVSEIWLLLLEADRGL